MIYNKHSWLLKFLRGINIYEKLRGMLLLQASFCEIGMFLIKKTCQLFEATGSVHPLKQNTKFDTNCFEGTVTGAKYLDFLESYLNILHDMPLAERQYLWFQQDGTPPHYSAAVR